MLVASSAPIAPTLVTHTSAGSGTETIPTGAVNCVIEVWGGTGNGGSGTGSGCAAHGGGGGGGGGYSRTSLAVTGGSTFAYTVGAALGNSSVSSGTQTVSTLTGNGGATGTSGGLGTGGAGGSASGGTAANTTGNAGGTGGAGNPGGAGALPISGINTTGTAGGHGGSTAANTDQTNGSAGVVAFYYT